MHYRSDSVLRHCGGVDPSLVERHLARMPEAYHDRYGPAEVGRHVRLVARLTDDAPVEVEARALGGAVLELCVAGLDRTGALAAITTALASEGFDVQDLHIATAAADGDGPAYFVDAVRVTSARGPVPAGEVAVALRGRLALALKHLARGDLAGAQTAASDSRWTPDRPARPSRPAEGAAEGMVLDGFRLDARLARGGMGEVFLATQLSLGRQVAVKVSTADAAQSPDAAGRFANEARALAGFSCPHIVPVYAAGTTVLANGSPLRWLAMEYLPNGDLAAWLRRHGPPPAGLGVRWLEQALQGLHYAHQNATLHRDLKPHNLLLTAGRDVKLTDFGLLKRTTPGEPGRTAHGTVMGTPHYLAPEQALGEAVDERSDVFALGVTFFQVFSGRLPFGEANVTAALVKITQEDVPDLREAAPRAPRPVAVIVRRMTARRAEDRYQDAGVALEDLRSYLKRGRLPTSDAPEPAAAADRESVEATLQFGRASRGG